jgi:hypothetical protein
MPLLNPRKQQWSDHFQLSAKTLVVKGKTSCSRATIAQLKMNDPEIVAIRRLLKKLGIPVGLTS